jgi:hypothetical protein
MAGLSVGNLSERVGVSISFVRPASSEEAHRSSGGS